MVFCTLAKLSLRTSLFSIAANFMMYLKSSFEYKVHGTVLEFGNFNFKFIIFRIVPFGGVGISSTFYIYSSSVLEPV